MMSTPYQVVVIKTRGSELRLRVQYMKCGGRGALRWLGVTHVMGRRGTVYCVVCGVVGGAQCIVWCVVW